MMCSLDSMFLSTNRKYSLLLRKWSKTEGHGPSYTITMSKAAASKYRANTDPNPTRTSCPFQRPCCLSKFIAKNRIDPREFQN
ncbi:hypothetical protein Peur_057450 [Populus x canadensis]